MGLRDEDEINNVRPGDLQLGQTTAPISSLNEAWLHTLDKCVNDVPLSEVILPLMRNCFFGGAINAVLLLQKGHGDHVASDIASFIMEEPQSSLPKPHVNCNNLAYRNIGPRQSQPSGCEVRRGRGFVRPIGQYADHLA